MTIEPGTEWTAKFGKCIFCGGTENGYAKRDAKGIWHPSCWECVKPKNPPPPLKPRKKVIVAPEPVKQENIDVVDTNSTVHKTRAKLATSKPSRIQRRKVNTNG